jgi:hypothetical protein
MVAAAVSFALCVVSDLGMSLTHEQASTGLAWALAWLAGHGLHGAVVVLLPLAYFLTQRSLHEAKGRLQERAG